MKKLSHLTAAIALGAACAMPVMAQDSSSATQSTATPSTESSSTQTMGAGPDPMDSRPMESGNDRDLGWIGLLGLAGLLGLRRKHHHDDHVDTRRTTTAR